MSWFIVDVFSDKRGQYRVAAETVEADASDQAIQDVRDLYPNAHAFVATPIGHTDRYHLHIALDPERKP